MTSNVDNKETIRKGNEKTKSEKISSNSKKEQFWTIVTPVIVTGLFGLGAAVGASISQEKLQVNRIFLQEQIKVSSRTAMYFSIYVDNWRYLIELKKTYYQKNQNIPKSEQEKLENIVRARNAAREKLFSLLEQLPLYFDTNTIKLVETFRNWDEDRKKETIDKLPSINEWKKHKKEIINSMGEEISKRNF